MAMMARSQYTWDSSRQFASLNPELSIVLTGVHMATATTLQAPQVAQSDEPVAGATASVAAQETTTREIVTSTGKIRLKRLKNLGVVATTVSVSSPSLSSTSSDSTSSFGNFFGALNREEQRGELPSTLQPIRRRDFLRDLVPMKRQSQVIETIPSLAERLQQQQQRQELIEAQAEEVNNGNVVAEEMGEDSADYEDSEEVEYEDGDDDDAFEVDSAWLFLDALLMPDRKPRGGFKHQVWADATWVRPCHKTLLPVPWRQSYHGHEDTAEGRPWVVWVEHRTNKKGHKPYFKNKGDRPYLNPHQPQPPSKPFLKAVLAEWKHGDLIFSMPPPPAAAAAAAVPTTKASSSPPCPPTSAAAAAASSVIGRRLRALSDALVRKTVFLPDKTHNIDHTQTRNDNETEKGKQEKHPQSREQQRRRRRSELVSVALALANLDRAPENGGDVSDEDDANSLSSPFRSLLKSLSLTPLHSRHPFTSISSSSSLNGSSVERFNSHDHSNDGDDSSAAAIAWGLIRASLGGEVEEKTSRRNDANATSEERRENPCPPPLPPSSSPSALVWSHYLLPFHPVERSITTLVPQKRQLASNPLPLAPPLGVCSRDRPMVKHPVIATVCPLPDQTATPITTTALFSASTAVTAAAVIAKTPLYPPQPHTENVDRSRHRHSGTLGVFSATVEPVRTSGPPTPMCVVVIAPPA